MLSCPRRSLRPPRATALPLATSCAAALAPGDLLRRHALAPLLDTSSAATPTRLSPLPPRPPQPASLLLPRCATPAAFPTCRLAPALARHRCSFPACRPCSSPACSPCSRLGSPPCYSPDAPPLLLPQSSARAPPPRTKQYSGHLIRLKHIYNF
jgi:hypothetical protein